MNDCLKLPSHVGNVTKLEDKKRQFEKMVPLLWTAEDRQRLEQEEIESNDESLMFYDNEHVEERSVEAKL